jgi:uncharacterized protein YggE
MKYKTQMVIGITVFLFVVGGLVLRSQAQAGPLAPQDTLSPAQGNDRQPDPAAVQLKAPSHGNWTLVQTPEEVQRTISVSGRGEVQAEPDQAIVQLGVQTQAEMAEQALSENSANMQALLDQVENAGIPAQDIQTQMVRLQPQYEDRPDPQGQGTSLTLSGYRAVNIVEITVNDLEQLGELLDAAVAAGGNTIEGFDFEISTPASLLDQAREAAMQDAIQKAQQLASLADTSLGEVLTINESSSTPPRPLARAGIEIAEAAAVPVAPGTQSITVDVQVTWLLE